MHNKQVYVPLIDKTITKYSQESISTSQKDSMFASSV